MAKALTTKFVQNVKPEATRREIPDPALSGLYLIVQPSGAKSWALRYRFGGRSRKLTLGKWPRMQIAPARSAATAALQSVELGNDPCEQKKLAKRALVAGRHVDTYSTSRLLSDYYKAHLANLKSGTTVQRELERHFCSIYANHDVRDISKRELVTLLDSVAGTGRKVTANRLRAYLNGFFRWCVERDFLETNPLGGVKPVFKEPSRDRVFSDDEIRWFWQACSKEGQPWGTLGKTLLLSGQRLGEVVGMTHREIKDETWYLPSDRTKNGRPHDVPLSQEILEVLLTIERPEGAPGYYHSTTGFSPLSGFHKGRNRLADGMKAQARLECGVDVHIDHWSFHDLRRTVATGMARLGIPVRVTEAVLNHVSGTGGGIVSVYQRHDYAEEKRRALNKWASFVWKQTQSAAAKTDPAVAEA